VSFHGVPLAWTAAPGARDPLAELFTMLAPPPLQGADEARITITLSPAAPGAARDPREEGYQPTFFHGIVQAYRAPFGALLWDRASRVRVPADGSPIEAEIAPADTEEAPGSAAVMLQIALVLALRREALFHLHAAALVHPEGPGLLVTGGSGAGKTTTTLALLEAGYAFLGDDTLLLRHAPDAPRVEALAFPREFHLGPATLDAFPRLGPLVGESRGHTGKRPLDPRLAFPGRYRPSLRAPVLVLFPTISDATTTTLAPLTKADAFGDLVAASAALLLDDAPRRVENLSVLRALLADARCYALGLGKDVLAAPAAAVAPRVAEALASATNLR